MGHRLQRGRRAKEESCLGQLIKDPSCDRLEKHIRVQTSEREMQKRRILDGILDISEYMIQNERGDIKQRSTTFTDLFDP